MLSTQVRQVGSPPHELLFGPDLIYNRSLPKSHRNQHVQTCLRRELASKHERLLSDTHYCHYCFEWVLGRQEWARHCQKHIEAPIPVRCGTITYCHTLVRPGYCPFHLGNCALSATERLKSWDRDHKLCIHVSEYIPGCIWPMNCPHPCCDAALESETSLRFHFVDDHGFSRTCPGKALSGQSSGPSTETLSIGESDEKEDGGQKTKRKPADDENKLNWMPSASFETASPLKRSRTATPTVCPSLVFSIDRASEESRWLDPVESLSATAQFCPIDIDSTHHGCRSGNIPLEWRSEVPLFCDPLSTDSFLDADNDGEDVFSQFIRSPSRSPSATGDHTNDVKAATTRKNTNIAASASSLSSWSGSSSKHNVHDKDQNSHQRGPRIRLRVGPPKKITLRFTRPKTKNGGQWSHKLVRKGAKRSKLVR